MSQSEHAHALPTFSLSRPVAGVVTLQRVRRHAVGLRWWAFAGFIIAASLIFHSAGSDPAERLMLKQAGIKAGGSIYQSEVIGGFTPSDAVVFAFFFLALLDRLGRGQVRFSRRAVAFSLDIATTIAAGIAIGKYHGTHSPFGDWRNLAVGGLFAFALWSTVLRDASAVLRYAQLYVAIVVCYGFYELIQYTHGGGEIAFYGRTPLGDHSALEYMVAAVAVSLAMLRTGRTKALWWAGTGIGTAVVLLSFRRYAWVELAGVAAVFVLFSGRGRSRYITGLTVLALVGVVVIALTSSTLQWGQRLASVNPFANAATNSLAATNSGHLADIQDGLDQVKAHPIFGLGVGVTYVGQRTVMWKGVAGMVHNGPISVWIKFGLLGVFMYFFCYWVLLRRLWRRRGGRSPANLFALATLAFVVGNLAVTLSVYPWPFETPGGGMLMFALIAGAFAPMRSVPRLLVRRDRSAAPAVTEGAR